MIPKGLHVIFYLKSKQTVNRFLNPGISCHSSEQNHYVLCCKRLNGLGQSVLNVKGTFCLPKSVFHDHLKTGKEEKEREVLWWKGYSVNWNLPFWSRTQICYFLHLGTAVVKWLSLCSISQQWLLAQWQEWAEHYGLVRSEPLPLLP